MNEWTHRLRMDSPWPERRGLRCLIVPRPAGTAGKVYPWPGIGPREVVILIEDDPLAGDADRSWSCVLDRSDLVPLEPLD